jgi:hypothetical protein
VILGLAPQARCRRPCGAGTPSERSTTEAPGTRGSIPSKRSTPGAPKGRRRVAWGVSPRITGLPFTSSPEGATARLPISRAGTVGHTRSGAS